MNKQRWRLFSTTLLLLLSSWAPPCIGLASLRSEDRLQASLEELVSVLRDIGGEVSSGINKLLQELQQERAARGEEVLALKEQVTYNKRVIDNLRSEITALTRGACPASVGVVVEGGNLDARGRGLGGDERGRASAPGLGRDDGESAEDTTPTGECPSPYVRSGKYCLTLLKERHKWEFARSRCHIHARSKGGPSVKGDLVVPHDMEAFKAFITEADFEGAPTGRAWVGGSTEGWNGVWAWVDGSLMNELPWVYSQSGGEGSRIAVDNESLFHTVGDRENLWSICQYLHER